MSSNIMTLLQADVLLKDSFVLVQIEKLKTGLRYETSNVAGKEVVSFDDHFLFIQDGIDKIKRIQLKDQISIGSASKYQNELLSHLEEIQDEVERWTVKVIRFQGDVTRAKSDVEELRAAFESWYHLAASDVLKTTSIKLPAANIKSLATSEFNRLMDYSNVSLDALIEALKIEVKRLDGKRRMAKTKFDLGREQVNASWANVLPNALGISPTGPEFDLLSSSVEEEEEDMPAYVSRSGEVKGVVGATFEGQVPAEQDEPTEPEVKASWNDEVEYSTTPLEPTRCGVCDEPQMHTPSGAVCENGHGGAEELTAFAEEALERRNAAATAVIKILETAAEIQKAALVPEAADSVQVTKPEITLDTLTSMDLHTVIGSDTEELEIAAMRAQTAHLDEETPSDVPAEVAPVITQEEFTLGVMVDIAKELVRTGRLDAEDIPAELATVIMGEAAVIMGEAAVIMGEAAVIMGEAAAPSTVEVIPEIKGTFYKTGDPAPVTLLPEYDDVEDEDDTEDEEPEAEAEEVDSYNIELDPGADAEIPNQYHVSEAELAYNEELLLQEEIAREAYDPTKATGKQLDAIGELVGGNRVEAVEYMDVIGDFIVGKQAEVAPATQTPVEVSLIEERHVVTPASAVVRKKMDFDDVDDLEIPPVTPKAEPVVAAPVTPPPMAAAPKPTARKPANFDYDDF